MDFGVLHFEQFLPLSGELWCGGWRLDGVLLSGLTRLGRADAGACFVLLALPELLFGGESTGAICGGQMAAFVLWILGGHEGSS